MGAGAAQVLMKASGLVPEGRVGLAGSGPLLLLVAVQLIGAGAQIVAVLERTGWRDYFAAARPLPRARRVPGYLAKGLSLRRRLNAACVPNRPGIRCLHAAGMARPDLVLWAGRAPPAATWPLPA